MELARADMRHPAGDARCDVGTVLTRIADGLSGAGFVIGFHLPPGLSDLAINTSALETVLTTLIDNARQAGASTIVIAVSMQGSLCHISVADNGPGVPAGDRARIFEPFFTSRRSQGGTGLGLPIARALIEGNRGTLRLRLGGPGAAFEILVPFAQKIP